MFKKIFKAAKDILRSPVGQIGTALLLPGLAGIQGAGTMANIARGIGSFAAAQPMLTQAGIGLLAGDKPENVLRNVAYGTAARGIGAMMQPGGTFMGGVKSGFGITPTDVPTATPIVDTELARLGTPEAMAQAQVTKPGMLESIKNSLINEGE